jgi:hypothetical protein
MKLSCSKAGIIQQLDMLGVAWIQKALGTGGGMRQTKNVSFITGPVLERLQTDGAFPFSVTMRRITIDFER